MAEIDLDGYAPTDSEPFMNPRQREFFRQRLLLWKDELLSESRVTISNLQTETASLPDAADRASSETEKGVELRTRDRQRKLISKIDEALRRIDPNLTAGGWLARRAHLGRPADGAPHRHALA